MGSIVKPAHHHHEPIDSQREEINFKHLKQIENSTKMQLHLCWLRKTNNEKIVLLPHYSEKKKRYSEAVILQTSTLSLYHLFLSLIWTKE